MKLAKSESTAEKLIEKSRNDFFERMKRLNEDLKKKENLLEQYARKPMRAIIAYVTFNKVEQRNIVEHRYNGMSIYQYLCYDEKLKFRGKRLLVRDAPEPSTIIWENLGYKYSDRFCRRAFTTILSLLLIVVSFVVILGAEVLQVKATNESNGQERECPESFFGDSKAEQQQTVENDPTLLHCYCDQLSPIRQSNDSLCKDYLERNINAQILTFFASLVVLMVNFLIEKSLKAFCHFEKHFTEDSKGRSVFIRLFILKFINTGLVFLVNNNATILNGIFQLKVDGTVELTSSWFNNIGTTIILVQMGDIFFNHGDKFLKYLWYYRKLRKARTDRAYTLTQDELNKMQVGPQFEFAFNYAQLLSTIFVCLAYSTGIPLLYILGASNFLVFYFVEKYLFTNLYTIPPHFNAQIGKRATSFIPLALIFHLAVAVWVLSNEELFSNKTDERTNAVDTTLLNGSLREKLTGEHTFPLVVFLLIIILIRVVGVISKRVYQYIDQVSISEVLTIRFCITLFSFRSLTNFAHVSKGRMILKKQLVHKLLLRIAVQCSEI